MAINVTLGEAKTQEKPFPKLMVTTDDERIVFFISPQKGICLKVGSVDNSFVGEYYHKWNMDKFTDYNEPITIQNK